MSIAKECVDALVKDLAEIETDYLSRGDFQEALLILQSRLMERHYKFIQQRISIELHCGEGFCASVDVVKEQLERGEDPKVTLRLLRGYAAQTKLPINPDH